MSPLGLHFFGLTSSYRFSLFSEIHEIIFNSKGAYDWETVYHMPIWLRKFTFNKLKEFYDNENKKNSEINSNNSKELISKPNIQPTYNTKKASK